MSANPRIRVAIPEPSISVNCIRKGDLRAMTARHLVAFADDLREAIEAGLDPDAKVEFLRSGDGAHGPIYAARASSRITRVEAP